MSELVYKAKERVNFIQEKLNEAFDYQKSYADLKGNDTSIEVDGKVFLKVSP